MRLWTLHPRYLDVRGLVALWREALLAQKVLRGATKGYRNHPQLARFRACGDPASAIGSYLEAVYEEAARRGYSFDGSKICASRLTGTMDENAGQVLYEWSHLCMKLERRDPLLWEKHRLVSVPDPHPLFRIVPGGVQSWERQL